LHGVEPGPKLVAAVRVWQDRNFPLLFSLTFRRAPTQPALGHRRTNPRQRKCPTPSPPPETFAFHRPSPRPEPFTFTRDRNGSLFYSGCPSPEGDVSGGTTPEQKAPLPLKASSSCLACPPFPSLTALIPTPLATSAGTQLLALQGTWRFEQALPSYSLSAPMRPSRPQMSRPRLFSLVRYVSWTDLEPSSRFNVTTLFFGLASA